MTCRGSVGLLGCAVAEVPGGAVSPGAASIGGVPEGGLQCRNKAYGLKRSGLFCWGGLLEVRNPVGAESAVIKCLENGGFSKLRNACMHA